MDDIIQHVRSELLQNADPGKKAGASASSRKRVKLYGLTVPSVNRNRA